MVNTQSGVKKRIGKVPVFKRTIGEATERFIITAAQNATPVNKPFVDALHRACAHYGAEMMVIPLRYKNPTSKWSASQANEDTWAPEVMPFLWNTRKALNKNLVVLGDIKTQPTASSPLTGFDAITGAESAILGHTKLQLRVIPTAAGRFPKILTTTGACTVKNYTDSKAGKLGEFHHTLGAALVEIRGKTFHLRQLNAGKDGSFYDLDTLFTPDAAPKKYGRAAGLVMGDTHVDSIDPDVVRATFGKGGMCEVLRPHALIYHDVLDAYSVNPHHAGNVFNAIAKLRGDRNDIAKEVERAARFILEHTPKNTKALIVSSNHDDMLRRWIVNNDWRQAPGNAEFYLRTALAMVQSTKLGVYGMESAAPFPYWLDHFAKGSKTDYECLEPDNARTVAGIWVGAHGDAGPNGSRGNIRGFRRIGVRGTYGHAHTPGIEEGAHQVGTSTRLRAEYTRGPSSWMQTHGLIYPNGKRTLINIIKGEWRLI